LNFPLLLRLREGGGTHCILENSPLPLDLREGAGGWVKKIKNRLSTKPGGETSEYSIKWGEYV